MILSNVNDDDHVKSGSIGYQGLCSYQMSMVMVVRFSDSLALALASGLGNLTLVMVVLP